jgi:prepilin-type N-terminal cleavage/methylation domain-containing protein
MQCRKSAFTLIELLIVVAIIAILAAIAVPNFLEAQTRAKVSRAKADMRSIATAMEAYAVDNRKYPPCQNYYGWNIDNLPGYGWGAATWPTRLMWQITTPVAFMTSIPPNPFTFSDPDYHMKGTTSNEFQYVADVWVDLQAQFNNLQTSKRWALVCLGPDRLWSAGEHLMISEAHLNTLGPSGPTIFGQWDWGCLYDPTNGTVSKGDIVRIGP